MARPKSDKYVISTMTKIIDDYTNKTDLPILKEVTYMNNWLYEYVMELQRGSEELSYSIKRLLCKKEVELERGGLKEKYNKTMAVFSLKQLGWRDVIEHNIDTNNVPTININVVDNSNLEKEMYNNEVS